VAQVVDEDLPLALGLAHRGDEAVGLGHAHRLGETPREILVRFPRMAGRQGYDDMYALAAGEHRETDEPDVGELTADILRRLLHVPEVEALVGVEVEYHPVGFLHLRAARAP